MGINDILVQINYLVERVNEAAGVLGRISGYIIKVEQNLLEGAKHDLFALEDALNREFSIDLFVVKLEEKVQFLLDQPKIKAITEQLSEDIDKLKIA